MGVRGIHLPDDDRKIQGNARLGCLYLEAIYVERHSIWHVVEIRRDKWMRWSKKFDSRQSVELRLMSGRTRKAPRWRSQSGKDRRAEDIMARLRLRLQCVILSIGQGSSDTRHRRRR